MFQFHLQDQLPQSIWTCVAMCYDLRIPQPQYFVIQNLYRKYEHKKEGIIQAV